MSTVSLDNKPALAASSADSTWAAPLAAALRGLRFGSIEITVHDGRIVQIERRERVRLEEKQYSFTKPL